MLLLIDAGNSYFKWNMASESLKQLGEATLSVDWHSRHILNETIDQWCERGDISQVIISSVVDEYRNSLITQWLDDHSSISLEWVHTQRASLGVTCAYRNPAQMGVDRWVALIACANMFPNENCIVVDCGTAITVDTLLANGAHKGGVIFPGAQLMKDCLSRNTKIPSALAINSIEQNKDIEIFNQTTETAIQNGVLGTVVAAITTFVSDVMKTCNESVRVVITGGEAPYLLPYLKGQYHHEPDLIMKGLLTIVVNSR